MSRVGRYGYRINTMICTMLFLVEPGDLCRLVYRLPGTSTEQDLLPEYSKHTWFDADKYWRIGSYERVIFFVLKTFAIFWLLHNVSVHFLFKSIL